MNSNNPWPLVSLKSGQHGVPKKDERFVAPEDEAIKLVAAGNAWPVDKPKEPAQHLLSMLKAQVSKVDLLGPVTKDPSRQAAIAEELFPNGLRQDFARGQAIHWRQGKTGLRQLVGSRLSESCEAGFDLFALFRLVTFETPSRWGFPSRECYSQIYGQEYARETPGDLEDLSMDMHTPLDWGHRRDVIFDAFCLQGQLESVLMEALSDGRILVAEMARAGERFVPASVAGNMRVCDVTEGYSFALSSDLPEVRMDPPAPLDFRRKKATRDIESLYHQFENSGRRFTAEDVKVLVQDLHGLTPNAANEAWKAAKTPRPKFKNPKKGKRVSLEELRKAANILREKRDPQDSPPS